MGEGAGKEGRMMGATPSFPGWIALIREGAQAAPYFSATFPS